MCVSAEVCANGHLNAADVTLNSFKGPQVPLDQYWERKSEGENVTSANRFDKDTRASSGVLFRLIEHKHTHTRSATSTPQQNREVTVALRTADLVEDVCVSVCELC